MLESERLAYLNALGITQFVAQSVIEGAPCLPQLSEDEVWANHIALQPDPQQSNTEALVEARMSPAVTVQVVNEPLQPEALPDAESVVSSATIPELDLSKLKVEKAEGKTVLPLKNTAKVQRFALAVITVPDQFRLFVELALADAPGLSAIEHRMVSDLLQALGFPNWLDQHGAKAYRWPMVNNPRIAADPQAAKDGLLGFVSSAGVVQKNIFLGSKASVALDAAVLGQLFALGDAGSVAMATYSLADMNADWTRKADAWNSIQQLLFSSS